MQIRTASLSIIAAALVAVGCSSDAEPAPADDGPTISIEGFAFAAVGPVAAGADITVANLDGTQHTLTADDGSFNTGGLDGGATIVITAPDIPGTYTFLCNIHPSMIGSLTVEG